MKKTLLLVELLLATFFSNAQNVGIGTTTPLAKLHVSFGSSGNVAPFSPLVVEGNNNTYINLLAPNDHESGLLFGKTDNAASGAIIYNNANNLNGFQFRANGNLTKVVINNNGYVGIGIPTPTARLSVSSEGFDVEGSAASSSTVKIHGGTLGLDEGNQLTLASIGYRSYNNSSLGIRAYRTSAGSTWTTTSILLGHDVDNNHAVNGGYLAFAANGNIGIGIAKPLAKLHVSAGDGSLALFGPNSYGGQLYVGAATNQGLALTAQVLASDGNLHIDPAANRNIYLGYYQARDIYINPLGGAVGIGNNNPAYQMDISNRIRIRSGGNDGVSAGLWLNNNANSLASFIGMEDDTHVGFYGLPAGWKFGMNTQTGALKINGTEGVAGQVIKSNGTGQSAEWSSPTKSIYDKTVMLIGSTEIVVPINYPNAADIPGLTHTFTLTENTKVIINYTVNARPVMCTFCTGSSVLMMIDIVGGGGIVSQLNESISNFEYRNLNAVFLKALPPGTYTIRIKASVLDGPAIEFNIYDSRMVLQMIPE